MKYLFGPVNSRRLGISLGIDLVPHKTCTLNCVYCECGPTTDLNSAIKEYVPTNEVIDEIDVFFENLNKSKNKIDVVTFSGSGEPTLHSGIGDIISHIKKNYSGFSVVVLTNGTLMWMEEVRRSISMADVVIPSLDAISEDIFKKILRPANGITPERVIEGLSIFKSEFKGRFILEIFIIPGVNDIDSELNYMREACLKINPDEIHLNTLDRPGAEGWVKAADEKTMQRASDYFSPFSVKIIGKPAELLQPERDDVTCIESILLLLRRRPSTIEEVSMSAGINKNELSKIFKDLLDRGVVIKEDSARGTFYKLK